MTAQSTTAKAEAIKTSILTRRIKLAVIEDTSEAKAKTWAHLRDLRYACFKASNQYMTDLVTNNMLKERIKPLLNIESNTDAQKAIKDAFGKSPQAYFRALAREKYPIIGSNEADGISSKVMADFKNDFKEVYSGNRSIRNYKRESTAIPIRGRSMDFFVNEEDENAIYLKYTKRFMFKCILGRDRSHLRPELEKLMNGEWKFSDSQIQIKGKNLFLLLPIQVPKPKTFLDASVTLAVETSPTDHVKCSTNSQKKHRQFGSPEEYMAKRTQFSRRLRSLQKQMRETVGGHGVKKKLQGQIVQTRKKETHWIQTYNHQLSKRVLDFALKNNCGKIEIVPEALPKDEEKSKFVKRTWAGADLHTKIAQKADAHGIECVVKDTEDL